VSSLPRPDLRDPSWVRWLILRGLGLIYLSVFYSLAFQIHGLIGPRGLLPARDYFASLRQAVTPLARYWVAPSLLWLWSSETALTVLVVVGVLASLALICNLWPRGALVTAALMFLSFIAAAQDFSSYQSDGMLLEASLICIPFAPRGLRPKLGERSPPSRLCLWLLRFEWFQIYFESGLVKIMSGEEQWRNLTALDRYYENGPLPTWPAWYVQQHLPHAFHATMTALTLGLELLVCWLVLAPRRVRVVLFVVTTLFQIGLISTANYAFLNYLEVLLGVSLLCHSPPPLEQPRWRRILGQSLAGLYVFCMVTSFFVAGVLSWPARLLQPFRVADAYGLFATMTRNRYEIEFQGTLDGEHWIPYPFKYKPQDIDKAPGIYAPYQPRFEWNLWFAGLDDVSNNPWVVTAEERLRDGEPSVLRLFARDPFAGRRPRAVRAIEWQYWFTTPAERRATGNWWNRREVGPYAPEVHADQEERP
jgi:hypothetical protein